MIRTNLFRNMNKINDFSAKNINVYLLQWVHDLNKLYQGILGDANLALYLSLYIILGLYKF